MSYIKFEAPHLGDERWLEATPAAFVVHAWALSWCDEQCTDGRISMKRANRLVCPVDPTEIPDAFAKLVELRWWRLDGDDYVCDTFLAHGVRAAEKNAMRAKWAQDKRRRALCAMDVHELCGPRSRCRKSTTGQVESATSNSTTGQVDAQAKPSQTPKGSGGLGRGQPDDRADASSTCPDCGLLGGRHVEDCELKVAS